MTGSYSTSTLAQTEELAVDMTKEEYARGEIEHEEFEYRIAAIIGLCGKHERKRVLATVETVDITVFGSLAGEFLPTAWQWPV